MRTNLRGWGRDRRFLVGAVTAGLGGLLLCGAASADSLVHTGAFQWASSAKVHALMAKDTGVVSGTTVTYRGDDPHVVVEVPQPEFPFPKFRVEHVQNPTLEIAAGATVDFTFIDRIKGFSHSFQITAAVPPYVMFPKIQPVLAGTEFSPPSESQKASYANFTWHAVPGHYYYLCAIPGHAMMGMFGSIVVR